MNKMKTMMAVAAFALATVAHADWSTAPDGRTPLFVHPCVPVKILGYSFMIESADGRYYGWTHEDKNGQPFFEGTNAILIDSQDGRYGRVWNYYQGWWRAGNRLGADDEALKLRPKNNEK